jgi:hypothetical protein
MMYFFQGLVGGGVVFVPNYLIVLSGLGRPEVFGAGAKIESQRHDDIQITIAVHVGWVAMCWTDGFVIDEVFCPGDIAR